MSQCFRNKLMTNATLFRHPKYCTMTNYISGNLKGPTLSPFTSFVPFKSHHHVDGGDGPLRGNICVIL